MTLPDITINESSESSRVIWKLLVIHSYMIIDEITRWICPAVGSPLSHRFISVHFELILSLGSINEPLSFSWHFTDVHPQFTEGFCAVCQPYGDLANIFFFQKREERRKTPRAVAFFFDDFLSRGGRGYVKRVQHWTNDSATKLFRQN
jgi:hypothetical protein